MKRAGFTLVEVLVVVGIIAILSTMVAVSLGSSRFKARDTKRISDLSQIGGVLSLGCIMPAGGAGEYDLNQLIAEFKVKYPQFANNVPNNLKDPKSGSDVESNYKYIIDTSNNCVLYANLENQAEEVTLEAINKPTPRGGTGIFAGEVGVNGTDKYYQVSN